MADGTTKPIEQVKNGDKVLATDPETGETSVETVTAEIQGSGVKHLVKVTIAVDGDKADSDKAAENTAEVTATDGHPFWVPELGEWIDATDLKAGEWLRTGSGSHVQITAVERWTAPAATVHNLTVSDLHTYYVQAGATPLLVHNDNCPTVSQKDVEGLLGKAQSLYEAYGKEKATVSVARVWNRETRQAEEWVSTHLSDLPAEIRNNLGGAKYKFGEGDAEATIVGALGDKYDLLGIASSTRICPSCYDAIKGVPGMMETTVGATRAQLPKYTKWRTAINMNFWNGS